MINNYSGETLVLSEPESDKGFLPSGESYIFAVHDGRIERFYLKGTMRLGRMTEDNVPEIAIQNMYLSRSHGSFTADGGRVSYTAEETTNGISLNGEVIAAGSSVVLKDGDELTIPTGRSAVKNKNILLKCAFSPRNISLWSSMTEAQLDELTGLPGRRLFSEKFRTFRGGNNGGDWLFILDIDKFKLINDIYGHLAGDAALKALAEELTDPEYNISFPARWGGDEFVGIISGSADRIVNLMDRLIESLSSKMINNSFFVFVSVGICRISDKFGSAQLPVLLERADKALYRAKSSETEKIVFFGGGDFGSDE